MKDRTIPEFMADLLKIRGLDIRDKHGKVIDSANDVFWVKMRNVFLAGVREGILHAKYPENHTYPDFEQWIKKYRDYDTQPKETTTPGQ